MMSIAICDVVGCTCYDKHKHHAYRVQKCEAVPRRARMQGS